MEQTITFISLDHLLDMPTYAKLCGIDSRAVQRRIREKQVAYVIVDGAKFIDTVASPPVQKLKRGFKNEAKPDTKGVILSDLISISKIAYDKRITTTRFYKAVLLGKLSVVYIAGQFYIHKSVPAYSEVLKDQ